MNSNGSEACALTLHATMQELFLYIYLFTFFKMKQNAHSPEMVYSIFLFICGILGSLFITNSKFHNVT